MKCCSIKLANRTEERQSFLQKTEHRCHPALLENTSPSRSYDDSRSDESQDDNRPCLTVLDIMLPNDIKAFNTGSSIQRWANKRPRLRSARLQNNQREDSLIDNDSDSLDVSNLIKELQNECGEEEKEENKEDKDEQTEKMDPDIKKLLEEMEKSENVDGMDGAAVDIKRISFDLEDNGNDAEGNNKRKSKRKHKKKSKEGGKDKEKNGKSKKKLIKTVSFSLSKPPTPQTEQVIRVDVVSNCSVEFAMDSSRTDAMLSEPPKLQMEPASTTANEYKNDGMFMFQVFCTEKQEDKNFILESKKAVLFPRGAEK